MAVSDELRTRVQPFVAKYGTRLKFDMHMFEELTDVELIYAMSAKINEAVCFDNETREMMEEFEEAISEEWTDFEGKFGENLQETTNKAIQGLVDDGTIKNLVNDTCAIYIGNSYTVGVGSETNHGLFDLTKHLFSKAFQYVSGGAGFCTYTDHDTTFYNLIQNAIADESFSNGEVTHVFFIGAWGETTVLQELGAAAFVNNTITNASQCVNAIKTAFPACKYIGYSFAESRYSPYITTPAGPNSVWNAFVVNNAMQSICDASGMTYMGWSGWSIIWNQKAFSSDNYHPNDYGYKRLASEFIGSIYGSISNTPTVSEIELQWSNIVQGATGTAAILNKPGEIEITPSWINLENIPETPSVAEAYTWLDLYTFTTGSDLPAGSVPPVEETQNIGFSYLNILNTDNVISSILAIWRLNVTGTTVKLQIMLEGSLPTQKSSYVSGNGPVTPPIKLNNLFIADRV